MLDILFDIVEHVAERSRTGVYNRRTPVLKIVRHHAFNRRDKVVIVALPTKEIRRKKRRPLRFFEATTATGAATWTEDVAEAKTFSATSPEAEDTLGWLIAIGAGRY